MAAKIFVFGSINGKLRAAFGKLSTLHAKTDFSLAIVTGNLFGSEEDDQLTELLDGRIQIPCPTYFTLGTTPFPSSVLEKIEKDEEIAPNLHYLSKRSVTKTSEGIRIVTLGGTDPTELESDAKILRGANTADILLTTVWPNDIWKNSAKAKEAQLPAVTASQAIAELCDTIKPRYHLTTSPGDFCFEREPFFPAGTDESEKGIALTRFLSLAPWANAAKAKSMYAFTLNREVVTTPPTGSTLTPFFQPTAKKRSADEAEFSRFSNEHRHDHKRHKRRERSPPPGPDRCFFCLCNPNLSTHMVCSIGDAAYLATAKGPLTATDTFKKEGLDFPGHFIITPVDHLATLTDKTTYLEMKRFRESLQGMTASQSKSKLGLVTWEISRARNIHDHWQSLPVPVDLVSKGLVEAAFKVLAEDMKLGKFVVKDFDTADEVEGDFIRVWIWGEEDGRVIGNSLLLKFGDEIRFDLQYPRKVMAKLLGLEKRTFWQDVVQSEDEEKANVAAFREAFKEWDFTL
ncbi:CwfJ C-terminus 1-domain-containing protein-like protein [Podospora australis]|uniref:CwfJ C-terminus 1-domain-containing protein-like protein n=1 Tax=Podospora australis TaxID=1536484 RepID=A0AAN6X654_9PEZI|nr:CwfJ C-terminus 1-domain-containing protein-like protein [Podospora australis]